MTVPSAQTTLCSSRAATLKREVDGRGAVVPGRRAVLFGAPILALLTACAPSPQTVCRHLAEVLATELGGAKETILPERACTERLDRQRNSVGRLIYRTYARCVVAAKSLDELDKCKPMHVEE